MYILVKSKKTIGATIAICVLAIFLSSCSGELSSPDSGEDLNSEIVGTGGQLISIQSDNVLAAGYDANSMTMTVQFLNGYTYEYYDVPTELWNSFISAQPHPWSAVGYPRLVQGGFQYRRIG